MNPLFRTWGNFGLFFFAHPAMAAGENYVLRERLGRGTSGLLAPWTLDFL
jgi:hypothetical protein